MEEIEVPHYFVCPISLQIMKDPVTVPTGITYDRDSIETWLYSNNNKTCPLTKLPISDSDSLTPNHTLRRLIQAWCTLNSSHGVERFPTPKPPISKSQILKLLSTAKSLHSQLNCIRRLRSIAADSETNRRCIESAGAAEFLASVITNALSSPADDDAWIACDEAFTTLHALRLSDANLKPLTAARNGEFFDSLTKVMRLGSYESRAYAVMILKSMVEIADPMDLTFLKPQFFVEIVGLLKDQTSLQTSRAALKILVAACPWGRNRVKAVEGGGVGALVEILLAAPERRVCEMALTALDLLCGCADGRAALLGHGGGMAVVSKKILRVSKVGSERGVRILHSIAKFSGTPAVLNEMLELGIVAKLCLVLQVESGSKTKEKAREILKMHCRVWNNSSCIPPKLVSSFPAN